jgi:hypothetical protein
MSEPEKRVNGLTFEELVELLRGDLSETEAREIAALEFGWGGDTEVVDKHGNVVPETIPPPVIAPREEDEPIIEQ